MKTKRNTLTALLLLSVLLVQLLAACGGKDDAAVTTAAETVPEETEETRLYADVPDENLNGWEIHFIAKAVSTGSFGVRDVYSEAEDGDLLNDAVFRRNQTIEEKYNFTIKFTPDPNGAPVSIVQPSILAGDDVYDVYYDGLTKSAPLAVEGMLYDFYKLKYQDFDMPWWDKAANDDLSLAHKLYFTYGEHMIGPKSGLYCVIFNKRMAENYQLGNLYQYVYDNEWTFETFASLARDVYQDVNNNGMCDPEDIYGYGTEGNNAYTAIIGCGVKVAGKDENDLPYLTMNTDRGVKAMEVMMASIGDKTVTHFTSDIKNVSNVWTEWWSNCFVNDQMLFREGAMHDVPKLRNMDADFGILPMPKMDSDQDRYYHTLSIWNAAMMAVPITCREVDSTSLVLEVMACESMYILTPAYYELQLKTKSARDDESAGMLDIIFASKTFDIGVVFGWGDLYSIYSGCATSRNNTFASQYASKEEAALAAMQKTLDQLAALE